MFGKNALATLKSKLWQPREPVKVHDRPHKDSTPVSIIHAALWRGATAKNNTLIEAQGAGSVHKRERRGLCCCFGGI